MNLDSKEFNFLLKLSDSSSIQAQLKPTENETCHLVLDLAHIQTPLFELTTQVHSNIEWQNKKEILGRLWSQYSLINNEPLQEFSADFTVKDDTLKVYDLLLGNFLTQISLSLKSPHEVNANVDIKAVDLAVFMDWLSHKAYVGAGSVDGEIDISGTLSHLNLKGYLESFDGFVQKWQFERIHLNLDGVYPVVDLAGSTMTQKDRFSFNIDGKFDISDRKNFSSQIKKLKTTALIDNTSSETQWTMKRVPVEEEGKSGDFEYFIRKDQGVEWNKDDQSEMLGVKQKIGF